MGDIDSKNTADELLKNLWSLVDANLPAPSEVKKTIDGIAKDAMSDASKRHLRIKESAFVNKYVIPRLFELMKAKTGPEAARKSLLSESWRNMREFSEASPARGRGHPFGKLLGRTPPAIMKQWKGEAGVALTQPCPDFALRSPFPKIVFEAKYFPKGDREAAESAFMPVCLSMTVPRRVL